MFSSPISNDSWLVTDWVFVIFFDSNPYFLFCHIDISIDFNHLIIFFFLGFIQIFPDDLFIDDLFIFHQGSYLYSTKLDVTKMSILS